jgi:class 3 adenylate cyclase
MNMGANPIVLLVDDELDTVRLVRKILQADGCEVIEATDGDQAMEIYRKLAPDLILLDIILPQRDGLEILREIRHKDTVTGIIMASALTSERITIDSILAGADDYISKPFQLREMRVRIRQVLEKTALRRENARLQSQLARANARIRELLERYVAAEVMAEFLDSPEPPALGGKRQEITILYADIQGFTPLAESVPPDLLVEILNHYLQLAATAIRAHGGTLDKFMGDGVIGLFGAPIPQTDHPLRAVYTGLDIVKAFREAATPEHRLTVGIGINTGEVVVGNIGTPQLMSYTAIGDAMNLAQRLEDMAEPDQVLIGPHTYHLLRDQVIAEGLGPCQVRGRSEPIVPYQVLAIKAIDSIPQLAVPGNHP